jgi:hypothetical protein
MSNPTELADVLKRGNYTHDDAQKAADELRRLDAANKALLEALKLCSALVWPGNKQGEIPLYLHPQIV